jgi:hypothetical protein
MKGSNLSVKQKLQKQLLKKAVSEVPFDWFSEAFE